MDIGQSNILSDISPQARETKEKINIGDYIKLKRFCTAKKTINKIKRQPTEWENMFTNTSDKWLISKICKKKKNHTTQHEKKNPVKKWAKDPKRHCSKEDTEMANRHMKRCPYSLEKCKLKPQ